MRVQESYIDSFTAQVAGPGLFGGFSFHGLKKLTPVAGPIFETRNRAIFRERNFRRSITAPTTLFLLIGCGVDSFSPN